MFNTNQLLIYNSSSSNNNDNNNVVNLDGSVVFFLYYRRDVLPVTQPTPSKHCRKCKAMMTPTRQNHSLSSYFLHTSLDRLSNTSSLST